MIMDLSVFMRIVGTWQTDQGLKMQAPLQEIGKQEIGLGNWENRELETAWSKIWEMG